MLLEELLAKLCGPASTAQPILRQAAKKNANSRMRRIQFSHLTFILVMNTALKDNGCLVHFERQSFQPNNSDLQ